MAAMPLSPPLSLTSPRQTLTLNDSPPVAVPGRKERRANSTVARASAKQNPLGSNSSQQLRHSTAAACRDPPHRGASKVRTTVKARSPTTENGATVQTQTPEAAKAPDAPPASPSDKDGDSSDAGLSDAESAAIGQGSAVLGLGLVLAVATVAGLGYLFREELNQAVDYLTAYVEGAGPSGYVVFTLGYAALEVLAVPAIPLTMSAGLLFGPTIGTALCSVSATMAATVAFLIARYLARDRILNLVKGNKKYLAIDRAVGEDSFRVVTLLRLSPLLPFSLGNYVYGFTSVKLVPYVLGSWLGMLPGTWAYVSAGAFGRTLLEANEASTALQDSSLLPLLTGLGVTVAAAAYVTNLAKNAVKDIED